MQSQQEGSGYSNGGARSGPQQTYILAAALFVAGILLLFRNLPVGPIPAGDEFQYSLMARHVPYSQDWIPNYIFYLVYSSTNFCGAQYYACVKIVNVLFLDLAAVFVFLTSRLFVGWRSSFLLMLAFVASPFNLYSSEFMPETMYAAAAWILLYFYLSRPSDWAVSDSIAAGAGIALLSMIKPHGVFFGIAYLGAVVFEFIVLRKSAVKVIATNAVAFIGSFLMLRLSIGLLFAGAHGLNILGTSYGRMAGTHGFLDYFHLLALSAIPSLNHVLAMSLLAGVPLCILLVRAFRKSPGPIFGTRLRIFAVLFFIIMIAVTSVFTASFDTLDRLHTRYYNFFIFLFYLVVVAELNRDEQPNCIAKLLASGGIMTLTLISLFYLPTHFTQSQVDNPEIHELFWSNKYLYIFATVNITLVVIWAYNSTTAQRLFLIVQVPLCAVLCIGLLTRDIRGMADYQYQYLYPRAGDLARVIWGSPLPEYFVAGLGVDAAWHTHFHIDKLGTRIELGPNETLHRAAIPKGVTAGIIIGNNPIDFPYATTYADGSIKIIRITEP